STTGSRTCRLHRGGASSRPRRPDRPATSPRGRDRSIDASSLSAPSARGAPGRIEARQHAPQDIDLVLVERRALEDPPELQLELPRMRLVDEARLDQEALEVRVEMLELGGRRKARTARRGLGERAR